MKIKIKSPVYLAVDIKTGRAKNSLCPDIKGDH
jgi:hypothetical protein